MKKRITVSTHAALRMAQRGMEHGLDYFETKERVLRTIIHGRLSRKKHKSIINRTYRSYFSDNLTFFVVCEEKDIDDILQCRVKTVIIEGGRH